MLGPVASGMSTARRLVCSAVLSTAALICARAAADVPAVASPSPPLEALVLSLSANAANEFSIEDQQLPRRAIDGRDIACQAARKWLAAQALRARGRTIETAFTEEAAELQCAARVIANFLNLQACHQEDIAAANGLKAYYTRLALAEQCELVHESLALVDQQWQRQQAALQQGLATGVDLTTYARRRLEIADQQCQLQSQDRQLRNLLARMAGYDYAMHEVRQEKLELQACELDCSSLIAQALAQRYDMRSWQILGCHIDADSAPLYARLLTTAVGGFGLPLPTPGALKNLFSSEDQAALASFLRRELQLAIRIQRDWIEQTVAEKCAKLELAYRRLEIAQETVDSWQARRQQLEEVQALGQAYPEEMALAHSGWLEARTREISRRLEARLAEVELAEATGELARRCCAGQAWLPAAARL